MDTYHVFRMNPDRLTKQIFDFFYKKKAKPNWIKEVEKDLRDLKIAEGLLKNGTAKTTTKDKTKRYQAKINIRKPIQISEEKRRRRSQIYQPINHQ